MYTSAGNGGHSLRFSPEDPLSPRRILVTSALPYANGRIHIGHIAGAYLPADTYVRYQKMKGSDVIYVGGSDEHGVPTTLKAEKEGVTPQEIVDRYHNANEAAFEALGIDYDIYGRTTWPEHYENTQAFFTKLLEAGHIESKVTEQLHCGACGRFLADRYVEGTCHHCGAEGARGDQCDACGKLIDALQLVEPVCKLCGKRPEVRKSTHWFLKLGDFEPRLREWIASHDDWRDNVTRFCNGWFDTGLRGRAITRDLEWGVPLPLPDVDGKVIYVWFDAPIGYLTNTQVWAKRLGEPDKWKDYWQSDDCEIVHFIGKDNIAFHAITWPAMLMGVGEYNLPSHVVANEYLNFKGGKFSKSLDNMIAVEDFVKAFPPDLLRFYLTVNSPESSDSDFTWEDFQQRVNTQLADVLGNFIHRTLTFATKYFNSGLPARGKTHSREQATIAAIGATAKEAGDELERFRCRAAMERIMELAREGNRYFDEAQPWVTRKEDLRQCASTIHTCIQIVRGLAMLIRPFMPAAADVISRSLGEAAMKPEPGSWDRIGSELAVDGTALGEPAVPFKKYDADEIERLAGEISTGS